MQNNICVDRRKVNSDLMCYLFLIFLTGCFVGSPILTQVMDLQKYEIIPRKQLAKISEDCLDFLKAGKAKGSLK